MYSLLLCIQQIIIPSHKTTAQNLINFLTILQQRLQDPLGNYSKNNINQHCIKDLTSVSFCFHPSQQSLLHLTLQKLMHARRYDMKFLTPHVRRSDRRCQRRHSRGEQSLSSWASRTTSRVPDSVVHPLLWWGGNANYRASVKWGNSKKI